MRRRSLPGSADKNVDKQIYAVFLTQVDNSLFEIVPYHNLKLPLGGAGQKPKEIDNA